MKIFVVYNEVNFDTEDVIDGIYFLEEDAKNAIHQGYGTLYKAFECDYINQKLMYVAHTAYTLYDKPYEVFSDKKDAEDFCKEHNFFLSAFNVV